MAAKYVKIKQCTVCNCPDDDTLNSINADIINGVSLAELRMKYEDSFEKLTYRMLFLHKKHIMRSVAAEVVGLPDLTSGGDLETTERSKSFNSMTQMMVNNQDLVETVLDSAIEDLDKSDDFLELATGAKSQAALLGVRDQIRRGLLDISKTRQNMIEPALTINGEVGNMMVLEFLTIVRKAAEFSLVDDDTRTRFFNELNELIRNSKELRWLVEKQKEPKKSGKTVDMKKS